jgi:integral membrane sensor domain MASE1
VISLPYSIITYTGQFFLQLISIGKMSTHNFWQNYFVRIVIFTIIYLFFARIGISLATINDTTSPVWPVTGFACAVLFLFGLRYWPAIAIGTFIINVLTPIPLIAVT